ncbi:hypothetical protein G9A89_004414 [Geosiphon pyriformis]|nr:hypothetical protein G9A89_004414 [Geosiphon pyriformis]
MNRHHPFEHQYFSTHSGRGNVYPPSEYQKFYTYRPRILAVNNNNNNNNNNQQSCDNSTVIDRTRVGGNFTPATESPFRQRIHQRVQGNNPSLTPATNVRLPGRRQAVHGALPRQLSTRSLPVIPNVEDQNGMLLKDNNKTQMPDYSQNFSTTQEEILNIDSQQQELNSNNPQHHKQQLYFHQPNLPHQKFHVNPTQNQGCNQYYMHQIYNPAPVNFGLIQMQQSTNQNEGFPMYPADLSQDHIMLDPKNLTQQQFSFQPETQIQRRNGSRFAHLNSLGQLPQRNQQDSTQSGPVKKRKITRQSSLNASPYQSLGHPKRESITNSTPVNFQSRLNVNQEHQNKPSLSQNNGSLVSQNTYIHKPSSQHEIKISESTPNPIRKEDFQSLANKKYPHDSGISRMLTETAPNETLEPAQYTVPNNYIQQVPATTKDLLFQELLYTAPTTNLEPKPNTLNSTAIYQFEQPNFKSSIFPSPDFTPSFIYQQNPNPQKQFDAENFPDKSTTALIQSSEAIPPINQTQTESPCKNISSESITKDTNSVVFENLGIDQSIGVQLLNGQSNSMAPITEIEGMSADNFFTENLGFEEFYLTEGELLQNLNSTNDIFSQSIAPYNDQIIEWDQIFDPIMTDLEAVESTSNFNLDIFGAQGNSDMSAQNVQVTQQSQQQNQDHVTIQQPVSLQNNESLVNSFVDGSLQDDSISRKSQPNKNDGQEVESSNSDTSSDNGQASLADSHAEQDDASASFHNQNKRDDKYFKPTYILRNQDRFEFFHYLMERLEGLANLFSNSFQTPGDFSDLWDRLWLILKGECTYIQRLLEASSYKVCDFPQSHSKYPARMVDKYLMDQQVLPPHVEGFICPLRLDKDKNDVFRSASVCLNATPVGMDKESYHQELRVRTILEMICRADKNRKNFEIHAEEVTAKYKFLNTNYAFYFSEKALDIIRHFQDISPSSDSYIPTLWQIEAYLTCFRNHQGGVPQLNVMANLMKASFMTVNPAQEQDIRYMWPISCKGNSQRIFRMFVSKSDSLALDQSLNETPLSGNLYFTPLIRPSDLAKGESSKHVTDLEIGAFEGPSSKKKNSRPKKEKPASEIFTSTGSREPNPLYKLNSK